MILSTSGLIQHHLLDFRKEQIFQSYYLWNLYFLSRQCPRRFGDRAAWWGFCNQAEGCMFATCTKREIVGGNLYFARMRPQYPLDTFQVGCFEIDGRLTSHMLIIAAKSRGLMVRIRVMECLFTRKNGIIAHKLWTVLRPGQKRIQIRLQPLVPYIHDSTQAWRAGGVLARQFIADDVLDSTLLSLLPLYPLL